MSVNYIDANIIWSHLRMRGKDSLVDENMREWFAENYPDLLIVFARDVYEDYESVAFVVYIYHKKIWFYSQSYCSCNDFPDGWDTDIQTLLKSSRDIRKDTYLDISTEIYFDKAKNEFIEFFSKLFDELGV